MKTYKITFNANLSEADVKAMRKCFYEAMNQSMEIYDLWGLTLEPEDDDYLDEVTDADVEDLHKYTMHIDDIVDDLMNCENINEVNDVLNSIPRKFGEWWVDVVLDENGMGYYEVTNQYVDINGEMQVDTYDLEIEVEEEE